MNNQIFRKKMALICPRLACVGSNDSVHNRKIAAHVLETIQQLKKEYQNAVIPMREILAHPYNQLEMTGSEKLITSWGKCTLLSMNIQ